MANPELSFITVNYKTSDLVVRLIDTIKKFPPPLPYEIIVVDNNSADDSVGKIGQAHPDITLIPLEKNIGFAAGNNKGAAKASGRILIPINPDCEIREESFAKGVKYLDGNPDVGILGLKIFTHEGGLEQSARGFPDASTGLFGRSTFLGKLAQNFGKAGKGGVAGKNLLVDPEKTEPYDVDWVAGTIMLIRRDCWTKIGGFDEDYFMYWEDADLCFRAKKTGFRTVFFPGSYIVHVPGSSAKKNRSKTIRWFHDSAYLYIAKNVSPSPSFLRGFAWCALNLRAALLIAKENLKR
ncbi:MAG: glycosyltransferase family 2 protein [bacterium]|nr:glycosyltransferase family 2 protein [bacterium]